MFTTILTTFLATIVGATASVAVLYWAVKKLTDHFLEKDRDRHRAVLQADNETAIENLRSALTREALEHEIRFRRLDDKIASSLAEVYGRILEVYKAVEVLVREVEMNGAREILSIVVDEESSQAATSWDLTPSVN